MKEILPGQIWYNKGTEWNDGGGTHHLWVVLGQNRDLKLNKYYWTIASFMMGGSGLHGAPTRDFYEDEFECMQYVGTILEHPKVKKIKKPTIRQWLGSLLSKE